MPRLDDQHRPRGKCLRPDLREFNPAREIRRHVPSAGRLALRHGRLSWADRRDTTRPFAARTADSQARDRISRSSPAGSLTPTAGPTGHRSRDKRGGNYRSAPATSLRWWRLQPWPPIEWWTGPLDWIYCPAEFFVPTRGARRAVTSHDVLQALQFEPPRKRDRLGRVFEAADLILSVSHFNTASACWKPFQPARTGSPMCPMGPTICSSSPRPITSGRASAQIWACPEQCPICSRWPTSSRARTSFGSSERPRGSRRWRPAIWRSC